MYVKTDQPLRFYDVISKSWQVGVALEDGKEGDVISFKTKLNGFSITAKAKVSKEPGFVFPLKPIEIPKIKSGSGSPKKATGDLWVKQGSKVSFIDSQSGVPTSAIALESGKQGEKITVSIKGKSKTATVIGQNIVSIEE